MTGLEVAVGRPASARTGNGPAVLGGAGAWAPGLALGLADEEFGQERWQVDRQARFPGRAAVGVILRREPVKCAPDLPELPFHMDLAGMGVLTFEADRLAPALRRTVGGPAIKREQLEHLIGISRANRTVIQVMTFAAGAHPGMDGSFEILRFPEAADPDAVYVLYRRGSIYSTQNGSCVEVARTPRRHDCCRPRLPRPPKAPRSPSPPATGKRSSAISNTASPASPEPSHVRLCEPPREFEASGNSGASL